MKKSINQKEKIKLGLLNCRTEFFKTISILKKLLTAGRTNSHLKETYENLGRLIEKKMEIGDNTLDDPKIKSYLHTIKACKQDLKELEDQVRKIKFSPSPEDISQNKK